MALRISGLMLVCVVAVSGAAAARDFTSTVTESAAVPRLRPEYKTPDEPNQLFYVQRSSNSNTVVYAAKLDAQGNFNRRDPVEAFWRWFNVDGHKKPLNFIERMMAYGVRNEAASPTGPPAFKIAALPERKLTLALDDQGRPEALMQIGGRSVKVAYVYLEVVEGGLTPNIPSLDIFGTDKASGKAVHEHLIVK